MAARTFRGVIKTICCILIVLVITISNQLLGLVEYGHTLGGGVVWTRSSGDVSIVLDELFTCPGDKYRHF